MSDVITLSEAHQAMLKASGISQEVMVARGYRTIEKRAELYRLGYSDRQRGTPTLFIPVWSASDRESFSYHHHRPDAPRLQDGKPVKYEFPRGSCMVIDVHPFVREKVRDPGIPLIIPEGVKKADAAISAGLCAIALLGVWNWRGTNELGGKTTLPDLDEIAWKNRQGEGREVYLCFDSDAMLKPAVHQALERLAGVLTQRGADLRYIYLPHGKNGTKCGLDDFLVAGNSTCALLALASEELRPLPVPASEEFQIPYRETDRGLVWMRSTREGIVETPLTTFTARIVADVITDDGAETTHVYRVEAKCNGRRKTFDVPLSTFDTLSWPAEHLGVGAYVYPGIAAKDHARVAIRQFSDGAFEEKVYTHTGWRQIEDKWVYLHAGGVIDDSNGVKVSLTGVSSRYLLPVPPEREELREALQAALRFLELAPDHITIPLLAGVFRATLGTADFSLFLHGKTGVFKSEIAALAQRFFGRGMDAKHLPASWSSTDNALEDQAFTIKDALLVIDDFLPVGSSADIQRLHAKADRVLRAQGNGSGRQRMRRDGPLRPERPPRGLILATGEDIPQGQSLQARLFLIEVGSGDVSKEKLDICQADAGRGRYVACMAAFLSNLARKYGDVKASLPAEVELLREDAAMGGHRRTAGIVAELFVGMRYFLTFALECGAITESKQEVLRVRAWDALRLVGKEQAGFNRSSEPTTRFLELLREAISGGLAHMADSSGMQPVMPSAWGWRFKTFGAGENERDEWQPQGARCGYVEGEDIFLLPDISYTLVRRLGDAGDGLRISAGVLWKRMKEAGLLVSVDEKRETLKIRRVLENRGQNVLHLSKSSIMCVEPDIPDNPDPSPNDKEWEDA